MLRIRGLWPFLSVVAAFALLIGLFGFSASLNPLDVLLGRGRQIAAPDLTGMPLPRAELEAQRLGLERKTRSAFSLSVPRGSVIRQDPAPGSTVRVGDTIELTVSKGENSAAMPDAVGKQLKAVRGPLDDASIKVVVESVYSEAIANGVVMSQYPDPGVVLRGGEVARFEVSKGAERRPVPQVVGLSPASAAFVLGESGLTLGELTLVEDPQVPQGAVAATTPAEGTAAPKGAAVQLHISIGPPAIDVPDVVGSSLDDARRRLGALGLDVQVAWRVLGVGDPAIGRVVEQNPTAGQPWRPLQAMTLVVGMAPPAPPPTTTTTTTTTVPATTGPDGSVPGASGGGTATTTPGGR